MPLLPDQVRLTRNGFTLLMGPGTPYTVMPGWDPWSRTVRADQGGPRPYSHGSWVGSEWMDEAVVLIPISVYRSRSTKAEWMAAHQDLVRAFAAVGSSGEMCELAFEWGGREYAVFGRPRQVRVSTENVSVGKSLTQCAFVAADPRVYSADLLTVSTPLPVQQGGLIVPARVATTRLRLPGVTGAYASTPDHASLDITGDIDLRADADLRSWASGAQQTLVGKYLSTGNQRSYRLRIGATGLPGIQWSTNGSTILTENASTPVPIMSGRLAVRATLDVDNGAAQRVATFYTAPTLSGPWTQLGTNTPVAGVTSIHPGTAALEVGAINLGASDLAGGVIHGAEVRSSIGGTAAANPDFTAQAFGATSFQDSTGKTWTVHGDAHLVGNTYRGGVTIPTAVPGRLVGGLLTLTNSGTTASPLLLRLDGPAVEPWIRIRRADGSVQSVTFDLTLTDGQWLTVDSITRQALLNDEPASNQRGRATWDMDAYPLLPGVNTIRFGAAEYNADGQVTASARSAWF